MSITQSVAEAIKRLLQHPPEWQRMFLRGVFVWLRLPLRGTAIIERLNLKIRFENIIFSK